MENRDGWSMPSNGTLGSETAVQTTASTQELAALQQVAGTDASAQSTRRVPLGRLRRLGGMYGWFTFRTKTGDRTLAFERGTVTSVASGDIVVRAADGTTMTWLLVSDTVIRDKGAKATASALSVGELVSSAAGARDARLIAIGPAPTKAGPSASVS